MPAAAGCPRKVLPVKKSWPACALQSQKQDPGAVLSPNRNEQWVEGMTGGQVFAVHSAQPICYYGDQEYDVIFLLGYEYFEIICFDTFEIIVSFYSLCPHEAQHSAVIIRCKSVLWKRMVCLIKYFPYLGKHMEETKESDTGKKSTTIVYLF